MQTVGSADGTTIAFESIGVGPPLVLVGGALSDRTGARPLAEVLGAHFTVSVYDRRGRGDSGDRDAGTGRYEPEREIEDLAAVIGAVGGPASVYGHSSGAVLSLYAAASGAAITRLVAYEPPWILPGDRPVAVGLDTRVRQLVADGQRSEAVEAFLTEGPQVPVEVVNVMKQAPFWAAMEQVAHTLPYDLAVCGDMIIPTAQLAEITQPTLVLSGEDSEPWATNTASAVAAALPHGVARRMPGQTHNAAVDVVAPALVEFLSPRA